MEQAKKIKEFETKVGLALSGYSMEDVAKEMNVSSTLVHQVVKGRAKSKRVSDYIKSKISTKVKITIMD